MPAKWIEHKGKRILYVDIRNASAQEFVAALREGDALTRASSGKVFYLGNIEGAAASREVMKVVREIADDMGRKRLAKLAVVGVSRGQEDPHGGGGGPCSRRAGMPVRAFKTEQEALDWLVE